LGTDVSFSSNISILSPQAGGIVQPSCRTSEPSGLGKFPRERPNARLANLRALL
jgi:hypothetical protein